MAVERSINPPSLLSHGIEKKVLTSIVIEGKVEEEPASFESFRETERAWQKQKEMREQDEKKEELSHPSEVFSRSWQAKEYLRKQPVFYDRSGMFWIWNFEKKFWEKSDDIDILNSIVEKIGANVISAKERNEILIALQLEARKAIPKPAEPTWIQFRNGIVDYRYPETILEPSPAYFVTNPIPYALTDSSETPIMDRIITEWVGAEKLKSLYQKIAYCLIPDYPLHRIFAFLGGGSNGKSKYLDLIRKFVGDYNCCAIDLDTLLNSRFEITKLHKKLVCFIGETNFNELSKTATLKKLSGGDLIGFEYKGKTPFNDKNYAKLMISTNNLPATTDKTIGFYRRWNIQDFPRTFTEEKDILAEIPEEEYDNLCRKCIYLLQELMQKRCFDAEGSIEDRAKTYEDRSDPIEKFIKENTVEDLSAHIWKFEFEKRLNEFCIENKFRALTDVAIGRKMKEKGIVQVLKMSEWLIDGQHKPLRCWVGLRWK